MMVEKACDVRLLAMDVDGVLTRGDIHYTDTGLEIKTFNIQDGLGIALAGKAGLVTAIVTGRVSPAVERRAEELGVTYLLQGCRDKSAAIRRLLADTGLSVGQVAFMGDDLNDIPGFREAGWKVAVANASPELKMLADYVTTREGGRGAVREVIEVILQSQGKWENAVSMFLDDLTQSQ